MFRRNSALASVRFSFALLISLGVSFGGLFVDARGPSFSSLGWFATVAFALPSRNVAALEMNDTPRIHLRGALRMSAHAGKAGHKAFLAGSVSDDTGKAAGRMAVFLQLQQDSGRGPSDVALSSDAPAACHEGDPKPVLDSAKRIVLVTDDAGRFCVRLALSSQPYRAHFEARSENTPALFEPASLDLVFDLARESIELHFVQFPQAVSLDGGQVTIDVGASSTDEDAPTPTSGLVLQLSNEAGTTLGEANTNASGHARFVVPGGSLGPPGEGELRVLFAGNDAIEPSDGSQAVERQSRVRLEALRAAAGALPPASPEDGISADVAARAECADRRCNAIPTGSIEMRVGDVLIAAAPLHAGAAHLPATFHMVATGDLVLRLRYKPDVPFFVATDDLELLQPTRSARPWGKVAIALAGLGVFGWFVLPRLPSRKLRRPLPEREFEGVVAHRPAPMTSANGWGGRVMDAHDGTPIAGAEVRIERPNFQGSVLLIETQSIVDGAFSLDAISARPGDQLIVLSPLYTPLRRPLPTFGHLDVSIVKRRHALLERFVAWAKGKGGHFDATPEPTPAQVRAAAGPNSPIAVWADALEKAIYSGTPIDAQAQTEIDRLNPDVEEKPAPKPLAHGRNSPS